MSAPRRDAGFWKRYAAYFLDALLVNFASSVLTTILAPLLLADLFGPMLALLDPAAPPAIEDLQALMWALADRAPWLAAVSLAAYVVLAWPYFALMESSAQQATVGKLAVGIRVTDFEGRRIGFGRASARFFATTLSWLTLNLGHALAAWTPHKRALHDYVAGTRVENLDPTRPELPIWALVLIILTVALFVLVALLPTLALAYFLAVGTIEI
ncbi:MAG TPA: RDD family protein [Xanthomonadaceae bacterium]|nr:RDD family protein [Xanthomonadaceae bacterium]